MVDDEALAKSQGASPGLLKFDDLNKIYGAGNAYRLSYYCIFGTRRYEHTYDNFNQVKELKSRKVYKGPW